MDGMLGLPDQLQQTVKEIFSSFDGFYPVMQAVPCAVKRRNGFFDGPG